MEGLLLRPERCPLHRAYRPCAPCPPAATLQPPPHPCLHHCSCDQRCWWPLAHTPLELSVVPQRHVHLDALPWSSVGQLCCRLSFPHLACCSWRWSGSIPLPYCQLQPSLRWHPFCCPRPAEQSHHLVLSPGPSLLLLHDWPWPACRHHLPPWDGCCSSHRCPAAGCSVCVLPPEPPPPPQAQGACLRHLDPAHGTCGADERQVKDEHPATLRCLDNTYAASGCNL